MTPTMRCNHLCLHCWRPIDGPLPLPISSPMEPKDLLEMILKEQNRIISGYKGSKTTDQDRLIEAKRPAHVAISLMGEPTLYPYLQELIGEINKKGMTSFLVTNGTMPEVLADLEPTQLYLSLNAPDEELYRRVSKPSGDLWEKILQSLSIIKDHRSRTVIRMTLAKGMNMQNPERYAKLLQLGEPDFIEVKAYMHLGRSRLRLSRDAMPVHSEILSFSEKLSNAIGYVQAGEVPLSRVTLLSSGKVPNKII